MDKLPWIIGFSLILSIPTKVAANTLEAKNTKWVSCFFVNLLVISSWNVISEIFKQLNFITKAQNNSLIIFITSILLGGLIITFILKSTYTRAIGIAMFPIICLFGLAFFAFIVAGIIGWIMMYFDHPEVVSKFWQLLTTIQPA